MSSVQTPTPRTRPLAQPAPPATAARQSMMPVAQVFLCDFAAKVLWGIAGLALIRFLPADQYAILTVALALSNLMIEGVSENLNRIYIVGYTKLGLAGAASGVLTLQFCVLAILIALLSGFWNGGGLFVALVAALAFAGSLLAFAKTVLQRELKFWSFSLVELARTLLFAIALGTLIVVARTGVKAWQVLMLQAGCVALVAVVALVRTLVRSRLGRPLQALAIGRQIVAGGYAMMVGYILAVAVLARVDVLMLKRLDSPFELATYGSAFRYHAMLALLLAAVHSVLLPLTQRTTRKDELQAIFARYRRAVLAVVPLVMLGAWVSAWFIPLIDAGKYAGAVNVFRVLCISTMIGLACSPYVNLLFRYADFVFLFAVASASLVLNVSLTAALIPKLHALGAAVAVCIATGAMNLCIYARARMLLAWRPLPATYHSNLDA